MGTLDSAHQTNKGVRVQERSRVHKLETQYLNTEQRQFNLVMAERHRAQHCRAVNMGQAANKNAASQRTMCDSKVYSFASYLKTAQPVKENRIYIRSRMTTLIKQINMDNRLQNTTRFIDLQNN